jgi:hypothetical protein
MYAAHRFAHDIQTNTTKFLINTTDFVIFLFTFYETPEKAKSGESKINKDLIFYVKWSP